MRTTSPPAEPSGNNTLAFYGGAWVGLVPIVVLVGGISWLSFARQGGTKAFWAFAWLALVAGLLVAKDKGRYCRSAMRGLADEGGIAIIVAWMFASILGALMNAGGLVEGITWLGTLSGVDRSAFTLATYVSAMLFAVGTGTSNGTAIALVPVLYPAGIALGADPTFLALDRRHRAVCLRGQRSGDHGPGDRGHRRDECSAVAVARRRDCRCTSRQTSHRSADLRHRHCGCDRAGDRASRAVPAGPHPSSSGRVYGAHQTEYRIH